uniref:Uncharacterized protein n=1 Tax=Anopheles culicifacies TaxID=139723 RepID=A0A182MNU5_9DIPT
MPLRNETNRGEYRELMAGPYSVSSDGFAGTDPRFRCGSYRCHSSSDSEEKESLVPPGTVRNRPEPSEPSEPSESSATVGTIETVWNYRNRRNRLEPSESSELSEFSPYARSSSRNIHHQTNHSSPA